MHKNEVLLGQRYQLNPTKLNLLEEKVEHSIEYIGIRDNFLNITIVAQTPTNHGEATLTGHLLISD